MNVAVLLTAAVVFTETTIESVDWAPTGEPKLGMVHVTV
jgi:hypothetical protein